MMKKIALLFLLVSNVLAAQNAYNAKGNRHGKWSGIYEDTKNLRYEGEFNDGKEIGIFYLYDNTKKKVVIATRDFSMRDGSALETFFLQNGTKISQGVSKNGKKQGQWIYFFKNGRDIMSEEYYVNGNLEGVSKSYYKNGNILEIKNYKSNKLNGSYKRYAEAGILLQNLNYLDDKLNGIGEYYTSSGKIYTKGEYNNNNKIGHWAVYDKNGNEVTLSKTQITNPKRTAKKSQNKTK